MSSNFEWQKHQVNERIQSALQEAQSHRKTKLPSTNRGISRFSIVKRLLAASKALMLSKHIADIPENPQGERLIDY